MTTTVTNSSIAMTTHFSRRNKEFSTLPSPCRVLVGSQPINPSPVACIAHLFSLNNLISTNATNPTILANALYNSAGVVNTSYDSMGSSQLPNTSLIQTNAAVTGGLFGNSTVPGTVSSSLFSTFGIGGSGGSSSSGGGSGGSSGSGSVSSGFSSSATTSASTSTSTTMGQVQVTPVAPSTLPLLAWGPNGLLAFACHAYIVVLHAPYPLTVLTTLDDHPTLITAIAWYSLPLLRRLSQFSSVTQTLCLFYFVFDLLVKVYGAVDFGFGSHLSTQISQW